ncbi:MAG: hypothetical protein AB8F78_03265 [Saprospiraceae bacterium]
MLFGLRRLPFGMLLWPAALPFIVLFSLRRWLSKSSSLLSLLWPPHLDFAAFAPLRSGEATPLREPKKDIPVRSTHPENVNRRTNPAIKNQPARRTEAAGKKKEQRGIDTLLIKLNKRYEPFDGLKS